MTGVKTKMPGSEVGGNLTRTVVVVKAYMQTVDGEGRTEGRGVCKKAVIGALVCGGGRGV